uniref:protein-tyrosine-phosphatase n=1 Tax=Syphacia muris TaxID=451379 RepID=A0A0N5ATH8_9BILA
MDKSSVTNETPKPHPKRMTWRRPLQNTVNFRLGLHDDSSYLRKGPRKIKDFIKVTRDNSINSANNSGVKINSLKQMQDDCLSMPYNLEDLSLWSGNQLPETLHVEYSLKTLEKPQVQSGAFKSISSHELARTMESMSREAFSKRFVIVDCRYPYEYNGGHIKSAINIWNWKTLKATFYPDCSTKFKSISSKIPIFYCEFSQKRGPQLAEALRKYDRRCNEWRYPEVDYKEVYLLDGGYKKFFEDKYTQLCDPPSYVTMLATPYKQDLKRFHMHRSKSAIEINAAISDACNDTYFDCNWVRHNSCLLSSPTQFLQTPGLLRWSNDTPNLVNTLRFSESPEPGQANLVQYSTFNQDEVFKQLGRKAKLLFLIYLDSYVIISEFGVKTLDVLKLNDLNKGQS